MWDNVVTAFLVFLALLVLVFVSAFFCWMMIVLTACERECKMDSEEMNVFKDNEDE